MKNNGTQGSGLAEKEQDSSVLRTPKSEPRTPEARVDLTLRLEDTVAITFFMLDIVILAIFGGGARYEVQQGLVIAIAAVLILLFNELLHQAFSGLAYRPGCREDWREFLRPHLRVVRDWLPFLMIPVMYWSLWGNITHLLVHHDRDAALMAWDQRLFHCQPSLALQRFVMPSLTAWMQFAYNSHIFITFLVPCFVYLRRSQRDFRLVMTGLLILSFFGDIGYTLVPAVGPLYTLKSQFTVPLYQPYELIQRGKDFIDFARIRRDVFPRLHVAISFMVGLYA